MWDIKYVMIETCDCQGVADSPRGWRQYSFVSRTVLVTVRSSSSFNLLQLLTLNVNTFSRLDLTQVKLLMKLNKKYCGQENKVILHQVNSDLTQIREKRF